MSILGIWWKNVEEVPKGGISIKGDPNAWSKWNPFWRFQHKWKIFRAEIDGESCHVFFDDGANRMCCKKVIKTQYFAARIGSRDLIFSATSNLSDTESLPVREDFFQSEYNWIQIHNLIDSRNDITLI